jgi:hypothetical protein
MIMQLNDELWKVVDIEYQHKNYIKLEISNHGRVRNTSRLGTIVLKGTLINGYKAVKIQLFRERKPNDQKRIDYMRKQLSILAKEISKLESEFRMLKTKDSLYFKLEKAIKEQSGLFKGIERKYKKDLKTIDNRRKIYYCKLIHRLVAEYYIERPSPEHNIVAHLDYDKLNNRVENLKWMTREENTEHQKKSPYVIKSRKERFGKRFEDSKVCKLTSTKVMFIKKKLNDGYTNRKLAKMFNVSEMQISRIKRVENWSDVKSG